MFRKNKLAMLVGEFLGTAALTLAVLAMTQTQLPVFFIASAAGIVVALMILALGGISGAVFNPAMTIGLWTVRKLRTLQALAYIAAQFAGGWAAWLLFVYLTKISGIHNTGTYNSRVLVAEVAGAFVFAFIWAAAIYQRFNLVARAAAIGGGLLGGAVIASIGSHAYLNPAVSLGLRQFGWGTYVLGPVLGAIIGFNLYNLLFVQTEVAEMAESKAEKAKTSELNATLTQSEVEAAGTDKPRAASRAKAAPARRSASARTASARKAPARKRSASSSARRRNPNAA